MRGSFFGSPHPFLTFHTGNILLSQRLLFPATCMLVETSSCIRYLFKMTAVWAASLLIDDRDSSVASPIPPTVNRYTSDCSSQHVSRGVSQVSTDIPTNSVDRRSINLNKMSTDTRLTLGRHINHVSANVSTASRSIYRAIVVANTQPTDALSTHDPAFLGAWKSHTPWHIVGQDMLQFMSDYESVPIIYLLNRDLPIPSLWKFQFWFILFPKKFGFWDPPHHWNSQ